MATEEMVVDVSQDWALPCDMQRGLCRKAPRRACEPLDHQVGALGGEVRGVWVRRLC